MKSEHLTKSSKDYDIIVKHASLHDSFLKRIMIHILKQTDRFIRIELN